MSDESTSPQPDPTLPPEYHQPTAEQPGQPYGAQPPGAYTQPPYAGPPAPRFRDRVLGMRAVAGVALASVIIGGAGGVALGAVSNGDDGHDGRFGGGNFQPGQNGPGGSQFQQGGVPGQQPFGSGGQDDDDPGGDDG